MIAVKACARPIHVKNDPVPFAAARIAVAGDVIDHIAVAEVTLDGKIPYQRRFVDLGEHVLVVFFFGQIVRFCVVDQFSHVGIHIGSRFKYGRHFRQLHVFLGNAGIRSNERLVAFLPQII